MDCIWLILLCDRGTLLGNSTGPNAGCLQTQTHTHSHSLTHSFSNTDTHTCIHLHVSDCTYNNHTRPLIYTGTCTFPHMDTHTYIPSLYFTKCSVRQKNTYRKLVLNCSCSFKDSDLHNDVSSVLWYIQSTSVPWQKLELSITAWNFSPGQLMLVFGLCDKGCFCDSH